MKHLSKIHGIILAILLIVVTGCPNDTTLPSDIKFKAINCSAESDSEVVAMTKAYGTYTFTNTIFNISPLVNGSATVSIVTRNGNELPVVAGNEIEVIFEPTRQNETEATFTLPDGTVRTVTATSPSFKWTVPENFKSGMVIKGESKCMDDHVIYEASGSITLIAIQISDR